MIGEGMLGTERRAVSASAEEFRSLMREGCEAAGTNGGASVLEDTDWERDVGDQQAERRVRDDGSEYGGIRSDMRSMAQSLAGLKDQLTYLTGQLSVKCPAEAERVLQNETHIKEIRQEMGERMNSLSNRIWGIAAGMVMVVVGAAIAVIFEMAKRGVK